MDIKYHEERNEKKVILNFITWKYIFYTLGIILIIGLIIKSIFSHEYLFSFLMSLGIIFLVVFIVYPRKIEIIKSNNDIKVKKREIFFITNKNSFKIGSVCIYAKKAKGFFSSEDYKVFIKDKNDTNSIRIALIIPFTEDSIPTLISREEIDEIGKFLGLKITYKN